MHIKSSFHGNCILHFLMHHPSFLSIFRLQTGDCANTVMNGKSKLATGRKFYWNDLCPWMIFVQK